MVIIAPKLSGDDLEILARVRKGPNTDNSRFHDIRPNRFQPIKVDWRDFASCKDKPTELFVLPENGVLTKDNLEGVKTCQTCPVTIPCLKNAVEEDLQWTIRGGAMPEHALTVSGMKSQRCFAPLRGGGICTSPQNHQSPCCDNKRMWEKLLHRGIVPDYLEDHALSRIQDEVTARSPTATKTSPVQG